MDVTNKVLCVCVCVCVCTICTDNHIALYYEGGIDIRSLIGLLHHNNNIIQENTYKWDRSVQGNLENLKMWLDLQFTAINRKIDDIAEEVKMRRRHKKVRSVLFPKNLMINCALLI